MESVLAVERRSILMKEILDETAYRGRVMEDVAKRRWDAEHVSVRVIDRDFCFRRGVWASKPATFDMRTCNTC